jgi:hypothetical protein
VLSCWLPYPAQRSQRVRRNSGFSPRYLPLYPLGSEPIGPLAANT